MRSDAPRPIAIGIGLVLVATLAVLGVWSMRPADAPSIPAGLTEMTEAGEIAKTVELSRTGILTSTNYLGHRVYLVKGTLKNVSGMSIRAVDVKMTFTDYDGKTIHEETHPAFEVKQKPLEPGTEYRFEMAFENLPRTWNYRVPEAKVVKVAY